MNEKVFRMNCWFEGRVQGVGFRYQTVSIAKGFDVCGSVRNLVDGRVHLYIEGDEKEVIAFQQEVASELNSYIRGTEIASDTGPRTSNHFKIIL